MSGKTKTAAKSAAKPAAKPAAKTAAKTAAKPAVKSKKAVTKTAADDAKKRRHTFFYQAEPGSTVSVAGCFNEWKPNDKVLKDKDGTGSYQCTVMLSAGSYQYKFCVNETWCIDPANPNFTPNDMGTLNSVLELE